MPPAPCYQQDLPDVISANPSSDARSPTTTVPPSAFTCFFLCGIGLPPRRKRVGFRSFSQTRLSARQDFGAADISLCSGLQVCSSPRSFPPLLYCRRAAETFYFRAERASLPLHAPDMLTVRIQVIDGTRTFTLLDSQPCRLLILPFCYPSYGASDSCPGGSVSHWARQP